ncbi:MAG: hypothetical protein GTO18_19590 [Anaerolineales bacterium]|nr:hypothetical protein [Anaerolineales bacterium]
MIRRLLSEMKPITLFTFLLILIAIVLAGCSEDVPTTVPSVSTSTPIPSTVTPAPTSTEVTLPSEVEQLVNHAVADLVLRLGVSAGEIKIQRIEAVEWPDGSLGCPQSGMAYIQVITPGYFITFEIEGKPYRYHTDTNAMIILCDQEITPLQPTFPIDPGEIMDGKPWMPVDPIPTREP